VEATLKRVTEQKVEIHVVACEKEEVVRQIPGEDFLK
jgi:hypothetical protein